MTDKETKAIERCNELIKESHSCWIGLSNQDAIKTVLDLLDNKNKIIDEMVQYIGKEKISEMFCQHKFCCDRNCCKCVKEYFKRKVTDTIVGEMVEN